MTHPLVAQARKHLGAPYVWGGKGLEVFNLELLRLEPSLWAPMEVFDCSGLVTASLYELGFCDWRGSHSAGTLRASCQPVFWANLQEGDLLFRHRHVAIFVAHIDGWPDKVLALEACGGDQSTRSPAAAAARKPPGYVREHLVRLPRSGEGGSGFDAAGRLPFSFTQGHHP